MATPKELLAASLEVLHSAGRDGVVRSSEISRTHRERLKRNGFLEEVTKGWLIVTNPAILKGSGTSWYVSFWPFIRRYLSERFGDGYCLSPALIAGTRIVSPYVSKIETLWRTMRSDISEIFPGSPHDFVTLCENIRGK